jgi:hypothetical protein
VELRLCLKRTIVGVGDKVAEEFVIAEARSLTQSWAGRYRFTRARGRAPRPLGGERLSPASLSRGFLTATACRAMRNLHDQQLSP